MVMNDMYLGGDPRWGPGRARRFYLCHFVSNFPFRFHGKSLKMLFVRGPI